MIFSHSSIEEPKPRTLPPAAKQRVSIVSTERAVQRGKCWNSLSSLMPSPIILCSHKHKFLLLYEYFFHGKYSQSTPSQHFTFGAPKAFTAPIAAGSLHLPSISTLIHNQKTHTSFMLGGANTHIPLVIAERSRLCMNCCEERSRSRNKPL